MNARWTAVLSGVLVGGACAALLVLPPVRDLEQQFGLPWLFHMRGPVEPPGDVVLVLMSQDAAANISLPREPERFHRCEDLRVGVPPASHLGLPSMPSRWPRCVHAKLLSRLAESGADLVVFDVLFRERPPLPGPDGDLHAWQDHAFADAARGARVIVAQKVEATDGHEELARLSPAIEEAALGSAPFPLLAEPGRRADRFMAFKEDGLASATMPAVAVLARSIDDYPALREAIAREATESADYLPASAQELESQGQLQATSLLLRRIVVENVELAGALRDAGGTLASLFAGDGARVLNLYGPSGSLRSVPYDEVLGATAEANAAAFRGRAVFVGFGETTRTEQVEHFATAYSSGDRADLSGVEIAATAYANLLADRTIREPPFRFKPLLAFLAGLLAYGVCRAFGNRVAIGLMGVFVVAYGLAAVALFDSYHLWIPLVTPLLIAVPGGMLVALGWKFWTAHRQRAQLRHAFSYFVPREVVNALEQNAGDIGKSQESIECGCVATDAANYTPLAESMKPDALTRFLNQYFEALFGRVADHGGFVSDVMGDAMLAIWPDRSPGTHRQLLRALVELRDSARQFNERLAENRLSTRFGVDWGPVALTTVGAHGHYEYRAVGDAVNTAARIQELNKKLGTQVLLSHAVLGDNGDEFLLREIGSFLLRGKSRPVRILELLDRRAEAKPHVIDLCSRFNEGLRLLEEGDDGGALSRFGTILSQTPGDGPTAFLVDSLRSGRERRDGAWVVN
jgi:adenylate cyclase